ncbi:universal stress protein [Paraburkholderia unamae]|uniref:Universal stress protein n=2 Tax=Burkholderiaceae TaxID=119060 RepID=A0ACC6RR50_9BURK
MLIRNLSGHFVLKLLIPVIDRHGAAEAARHSAFLFAERGMVEVEVVETMQRAAASNGARKRKRHGRDMLAATCAILKDAGVPYRLRHAPGPAERSIAACVECGGADIVLVDASHLGFLRKWMMLARLRRLCSVPVTLLH